MTEIHPTVVEFVDTRPQIEGRVGHVTRLVRINGVPVEVLSGWNVNSGGAEPTTVELTLVATEVHFVHDPDRGAPK